MRDRRDEIEGRKYKTNERERKEKEINVSVWSNKK